VGVVPVEALDRKRREAKGRPDDGDGERDAERVTPS
jgi:hypothetical protein